MELILGPSRALGVALSAAQQETLCRLGQQIREWNQRHNLTSVQDWRGLQVNHFLDSLTVVPHLLPFVPDGRGSLVDVGSGAGLPGLPLAIALPNLEVTLVESMAKKVAFQRHAVRALGISNARSLHGRAEEVSRTTEHRERYDAAVARAVASAASLCELLLPLVRVGGVALLMKTRPKLDAELGAAEAALRLLGGRLVEVREVLLPDLLPNRAVAIIEKTSPTPEAYPRRTGRAQKRPLGS